MSLESALAMWRRLCEEWDKEQAVEQERLRPAIEKSKNLTSLRWRFRFLKKYNFTCQYCGRKAPEVILQIEHIQPRSKGGTDDESNLTLACRDCNLGKSNIPLDVL